MPVSGAFAPHGQQRAPNGEQCNTFVRQMMVPTDFPIIKELPNRIASLTLELRKEILTPRYVIGSSIRAPGCERDAWATIMKRLFWATTRFASPAGRPDRPACR